MTVVMAPPPLVRPEPERDQYGRYVIPHPRTGEKWAWTRVTTWANAISDNFGLEKWKIRMTAVGLVRRPDLYASVAAIADPNSKDGKKQLGRLCDDAQEFAGSHAAANLGTSLHSFAQQLDIGRQPTVPPPWDRDIAVYQQTLKEAGLEVSPNWVERIVVLPDLDVAGTMDRLVRWRGRFYVGDVKTGEDLSYSWLEIAIQTALYAHAETMFDVDQNRHSRMPTVDQDHAFVIHLPAGQARCSIHVVDIRAGWRTALICGQVREWRKRKDVAHTLEQFLATGGA